MNRSVISLVLIHCCAFLLSQDLRVSRTFEARKKNVPIKILNNHPSHFYVLRLNSAVHDMTVERRAKPGAEILSFTPLKLDSVNAGWFNYEHLDHLFFESEDRVFFVFEKVQNTKKTIYIKTLDETGRSNGFTEITSLQREASSHDFGFIFKRTAEDNILIIAFRHGRNGITRKTAILFDPRTLKTLWTRRLPFEVSATEYTGAFECNGRHDLFYTKTTSSIIGYETGYRDNIRYTEPVLRLDSLFVIKWAYEGDAPQRKYVSLNGMTRIRNGFILPQDQDVFISLQGLCETPENDSVQGLVTNIRLETASMDLLYNRASPYTPALCDQLTFYDNPRKEFYYKDYTPFRNYQAGSLLYSLYERTEGYYYKELLLFQSDLRSGEVLSQKVVPRKVFFFRNRTRFKGMGNVMASLRNDSLELIVLENPDNFRRDPETYDYPAFRKETRLFRAHVMVYSMGREGRLKKRLIYRNSEFDLVPLQYESRGQHDLVFYLNNQRKERFATWNWNP
jgi:hypothetical protein